VIFLSKFEVRIIQVCVLYWNFYGSCILRYEMSVDRVAVTRPVDAGVVSMVICVIHNVEIVTDVHTSQSTIISTLQWDSNKMTL